MFLVEVVRSQTIKYNIQNSELSTKSTLFFFLNLKTVEAKEVGLFRVVFDKADDAGA